MLKNKNSVKNFRKVSRFNGIQLKSEPVKNIFTEAQTITFSRNGKEFTKVKVMTFVNMSTGDIFIFNEDGALDIKVNILRIPEAICNIDPEKYDVAMMTATYNHLYRRYSPIIPYINPVRDSLISVSDKVR